MLEDFLFRSKERMRPFAMLVIAITTARAKTKKAGAAVITSSKNIAFTVEVALESDGMVAPKLKGCEGCRCCVRKRFVVLGMDFCMTAAMTSDGVKVAAAVCWPPSSTRVGCGVGDAATAACGYYGRSRSYGLGSGAAEGDNSCLVVGRYWARL